MAGIEPLVQTSELKTNRLSGSAAQAGANRVHAFHYDDLVDAVTILLIQPDEGVVAHYIDDHVGLLYEEDSLEVVGLKIDAFEKVFLPANKAIQGLWLNIHSDEIKDFGQLTVVFERTQPKVVAEVVKAARPRLGPAGAKLAALVA
jgi:hypothetical protein